MTKKTLREPLDKAIEIVGLKKLADELGITYQSIRGWQLYNRMPDSEYSCRTRYSEKIEKLTKGKVKRSDLLSFVPPCKKVKK